MVSIPCLLLVAAVVILYPQYANVAVLVNRLNSADGNTQPGIGTQHALAAFGGLVLSLVALAAMATQVQLPV